MSTARRPRGCSVIFVLIYFLVLVLVLVLVFHQLFFRFSFHHFLVLVLV